MSGGNGVGVLGKKARERGGQGGEEGHTEPGLSRAEGCVKAEGQAPGNTASSFEGQEGPGV